MVFTLPIYWTRGTRKQKTSLCGMNQHNAMHYQERNNMKKYLEDQLLTQFSDIGPILGTYKVHYNIYYKNPSCDGSNIFALMEKAFLDALQTHNLTREDNVLHHLGSAWSIAGQDKLNPRCEIHLSKA